MVWELSKNVVSKNNLRFSKTRTFKTNDFPKMEYANQGSTTSTYIHKQKSMKGREHRDYNRRNKRKLTKES